MKTKQSKVFTSIQGHTQSGGSFDFEVPRAAILYGTGKVAMSQEDKIDDTLDRLCDAFEGNNLN